MHVALTPALGIASTVVFVLVVLACYPLPLCAGLPYVNRTSFSPFNTSSPSCPLVPLSLGSALKISCKIHVCELCNPFAASGTVSSPSSGALSSGRSGSQGMHSSPASASPTTARCPPPTSSSSARVAHPRPRRPPGVVESVEDAHSPAPEADNEDIVISEFGIQAGDGAASRIILEASILKEQIAETSVSTAPHASRLTVTDAPQHELTLLREARERDDEAFGEHVPDTRERMDSLGERIDDAYKSIAAHDASLLDAQARLQSLGAAVSDLHRRTALAEGIDELTREVSAARDMLLDMCFYIAHASKRR
ncbi:uncharacterized protein BXZ73DRAFT_78166 [Epithele typhae]|uniref:uncharacterized protein n=1 Tax=Epithele typhae TaxID=378194 RepID=UPI002007C8EE|nr:uncharacterized protein BXZ73DRAFT_78166 [Epithele typhae]KAH9929004.1 hypothetical protein BXZ73DRAFT_78166 [Epithele typhae]